MSGAVVACPPPALFRTVTRYPGTGGSPAEPINGVIVITYEGAATELASPGLALLDASSATVASTVTALPAPGRDRHTFLVVPQAPLAPSATYYLADTVSWDCAAEPCGVALKKTTVFATVATADTTPPEAPPAPHVARQAMDACEDASCSCGTYHALLTTLDNPATTAVRYDLFDGTTRVETNAPFVISTDCARAGDVAYPSPQPTVALAAGAHHLVWRGYDLAGNEAIGATLDVDLACPAVTPPPDANTGGDAGMTPAADHGGCDAGGGTGVPLALGLLLALGVRRRR